MIATVLPQTGLGHPGVRLIASPLGRPHIRPQCSPKHRSGHRSHHQRYLKRLVVYDFTSAFQLKLGEISGVDQLQAANLSSLPIFFGPSVMSRCAMAHETYLDSTAGRIELQGWLAIVVCKSFAVAVRDCAIGQYSYQHAQLAHPISPQMPNYPTKIKPALDLPPSASPFSTPPPHCPIANHLPEEGEETHHMWLAGLSGFRDSDSYSGCFSYVPA